MGQSDQLAKVRAVAAKEDALAIAQGRAPPKKKAPKKPTQEKRGNPDGEAATGRDDAGTAQAPRSSTGQCRPASAPCSSGEGEGEGEAKAA